jgi:hypothetical protein
MPSYKNRAQKCIILEDMYITNGLFAILHASLTMVFVYWRYKWVEERLKGNWKEPKSMEPYDKGTETENEYEKMATVRTSNLTTRCLKRWTNVFIWEVK